MRSHTGFLFGGGLRVYFATPIFWNLHYLMHIFAYESILYTDDQCLILCTKRHSKNRNIMGYNIRPKINAYSKMFISIQLPKF